MQEGEAVRDLEPDGCGGFYGQSYPGQTLYFSRVMGRTWTAPLRLEAANRTFSMFLDGVLVYTDCPELDNRIGYLQLPYLDYDREEPCWSPCPWTMPGRP